MIGRYANYGKGSASNASFGAGRTASYDPVAKKWWVSIIAKRKIPKGAEVLIPYGPAHTIVPSAGRPLPQHRANRTGESTKRCNIHDALRAARGWQEAAHSKIGMAAAHVWKRLRSYLGHASTEAATFFAAANAWLRSRTTKQSREHDDTRAQRLGTERGSPIISGSLDASGRVQIDEACAKHEHGWFTKRSKIAGIRRTPVDK